MKYKDDNLPHASHIEPLSQELGTMLKEILTISKEIYGPLFNHQAELAANTVMYALSTIFLIIYFISISNIIK